MLSGEDITIVPFLAQGGDGCISVTSNIAPRLCAQLHRAWRAGDFATVQRLNETLAPFGLTFRLLHLLIYARRI